MDNLCRASCAAAAADCQRALALQDPYLASLLQLVVDPPSSNVCLRLAEFTLMAKYAATHAHNNKSWGRGHRKQRGEKRKHGRRIFGEDKYSRGRRRAFY